MHELGHLLGLCHPTLHTGTPVACVAIPGAECDPGATAMRSQARTAGWREGQLRW
jgi:hypothetical protein